MADLIDKPAFPYPDSVDHRTRHAGVSGHPAGLALVHVRTFFKRPAITVQPCTNSASTDPDLPLGRQERDHFVERHVLTLFNKFDDECLVFIQCRWSLPTLWSGGWFTVSCSCDLADRRGNTNLEANRGLPCRQACSRSFQQTQPKISIQCSCHHPPRLCGC